MRWQLLPVRLPDPLRRMPLLQKYEEELKNKLKWLMLFRLIFSTLLLGSSIVLQLGESPPPYGPSLIFLYGIIAAIFFLTVLYAYWLRHLRHPVIFAFVQVLVDTTLVTAILFVTGSFTSVFSFLYLLIIVYSSILLPARGTLAVAAACSIQFGIMVDLEYYGVIYPFGANGKLLATDHEGSQVLYAIVITMTACFAVALLSNFLSNQARRTKKSCR